MLHLASMLLLLLRITKTRNCTGVSCRMQEMYLIVFVCRYLDLFTEFISVYNTVMKITFIAVTGYLVYLMRMKSPIAQTYDRSVDSFPYEKFMIPPAAILAVLSSFSSFSIETYLIDFSLWLESVAILPQLLLLQSSREVENLTSHFVAAMGAYRAFYILNWIYRYYTESPFGVSGTAILCGVIQTGLYCDFFYYYARSKWYGQKLVLPE